MESINQRRRYQESGFWDDFYTNLNGQELEWSAPVCEAILDKVRPVLKSLAGQAAKRPLRICELGCGTSSLAVTLAADSCSSAIEVVGVDFSQEAISCNQKRHPEIQWVCCDALKLTDEFKAGSFDLVIAKTLLDCFLARGDASTTILTLFQQVRAILHDEGCFMLCDRDHGTGFIGQRGQLEEIKVPQKIGTRKVFFRTLKAIKPEDRRETAPSVTCEPDICRLELELPPLQQHVVLHRSAGCGVVVVWTADEVAQEAGLLSGDRLLAFDARDGKGFQPGKPADLIRALQDGGSQPERFLFRVERAVATTVALRRSASRSSKVASRRSVSQSDYLLRQQRARNMRAKSHQCPNYFPKAEDKISAPLSVGKGLFL